MICASQFKWNNGFGTALATKLGYKGFCPESIEVKSPKTGKVVKFELNKQEAIDNESWDGEFRILRSPHSRFAIRVWNY